jgi:pimeloyl-ACP methyl ester carboxylesterase
MGDRERTATLKDGRLLGWAEWGDQDGAPVLYFHGTPSSRLDPVLFPDAAAAAGVRLLSLDRPGIGLSTFKPDRRIADWPSDVIEFADAVGLGRFGVVGWSGGGPYVLACAARLADRLTGAALVAGVGPYDRPGAVEGLNSIDRVTQRLVRVVPPVARLLFGAILAVSRRRPEQAARSFRSDLSEPDRLVFDGLSEEARSMRWFLEAGRQGARGPVQEYRALDDWGFGLGEVTAPVSVWQGDADKLVPIDHGEDIAARAPGVTLRRCPGEGHLAMVTHAEEVLRHGAGQESTQTP